MNLTEARLNDRIAASRDLKIAQPAPSADVGAEDYLIVPERATELAAAEHPKITEFVRYLTRHCGSDGIADRSHINPADILSLLPHLMILDVIDDGADFRVRVFGTGLVTLLGEERTGLLASQFGDKAIIANDYAEMRNRWMKVFRKAYSRGTASHFRAPTVSPDRSYMHYHGMLAPMTNGSEEITQLVGIMVAVVSGQKPVMTAKL
ncbi:MAG: PAS domain-containing protein [Parvibaculum sp.]|nr:PAS domain-containing protein [Parvibaculum sp.]